MKLKSIHLNMKLPMKLFLFVTLVSVIPLLLLSLVLDRNMGVLIHSELGRSYEQVVRQYSDKTDYKLTLYTTIMSTLSSNSAVVGSLQALTAEDSRNPYDVAMRISWDVGAVMGTRSLKEVYNLMIFTGSGLREVYGPKVSSERLVSGFAWYRNMIQSGKYDYYFTQRFPWQSLPYSRYISFTEPILAKGSRLGFIRLDIDTEMLFAADADNAEPGGYALFVTGRDGEMLYGSGTAYAQYVAGDFAAASTADGTATDVFVNGHRSILVSKSIGNYGWRAFFLFSYDEIDRKTGAIRSGIFTIAALAVIVIYALTLLITSGFTTRIRLLVKKIEKVQGGDMQIGIVIKGKDEIAILDRHFNQMVSRLRTLIQRNYIQELEKREAELNALQAQINPHFLYNTLEIISALAASRGDREVCDIIHKLGTVFRYSIEMGSSEFVTLQAEIDHVDNYVRIQQAPYGSKFEVFYNVEPAAAQCLVLKFILQPIVENSIAHGFQGTPEHSIEVSASVQEGLLSIVIQDDGQGMSPEQVTSLNTYINERNDEKLARYPKSIGIKNVNMRIKLAYGEQYGIVVTGTEGAGVRVAYTLPANGGRGHVQSTDR